MEPEVCVSQNGTGVMNEKPNIFIPYNKAKEKHCDRYSVATSSETRSNGVYGICSQILRNTSFKKKLKNK